MSSQKNIDRVTKYNRSKKNAKKQQGEESPYKPLKDDAKQDRNDRPTKHNDAFVKNVKENPLDQEALIARITANLKRETDEITKLTTKKNGKPCTSSSWSRFEIPQSDEEDDPAADYMTLVHQSQTGAGHFQMKHEQEWRKKPIDIGKRFQLDMDTLNDDLSTIPSYLRLRLPSDIFSKKEIEKMEKSANIPAKKQTHSTKLSSHKSDVPENKSSIKIANEIKDSLISTTVQQCESQNESFVFEARPPRNLKSESFIFDAKPPRNLSQSKLLKQKLGKEKSDALDSSSFDVSCVEQSQDAVENIFDAKPQRLRAKKKEPSVTTDVLEIQKLSLQPRNNDVGKRLETGDVSTENISSYKTSMDERFKTDIEESFFEQSVVLDPKPPRQRRDRVRFNLSENVNKSEKCIQPVLEDIVDRTLLESDILTSTSSVKNVQDISIKNSLQNEKLPKKTFESVVNNNTTQNSNNQNTNDLEAWLDTVLDD